MGAPLDQPLATYLHDQGLGSAALLTSDDAFGRDNGSAFTKAWTDLGGKIVASETFPLSATDFTPQLIKIRAADPQALYVVAIGDTEGLVAKQARALGISAEMGGPLVTDSTIEIAGAAANGFLDTGIAVDPSTSEPEAKVFLDAYKDKYGSYPQWPMGTPYEAVRLLASLIHDVVADGGDPQSGAALLKELEAHPSFQNYLSGGKVTLLKDHGSTRAIAIRQVKDGKFVTVKIVQP
jgi:branched-chain amino acid transport system substrate-binding protein